MTLIQVDTQVARVNVWENVPVIAMAPKKELPSDSLAMVGSPSRKPRKSKGAIYACHIWLISSLRVRD